jgi:hypothetical protein
MRSTVQIPAAPPSTGSIESSQRICSSVSDRPSAALTNARSTIFRAAVSGSMVKSLARYMVAANPAMIARPLKLIRRNNNAVISATRKGARPACTAGLLSSSCNLTSGLIV